MRIRTEQLIPSSSGNNTKVAVVIHIFYADLNDEIAQYLKSIPCNFDLYITTRPELITAVRNYFSNFFKSSAVYVAGVENKGRDIYPFLSLSHLYNKYDLVCKIHTKKRTDAGTLVGWRTYLLDNLIGSRKIVETIISSFDSNKKLGLIFPEYFNCSHIQWGSNYEIAMELSNKIGISLLDQTKIDFPAGSMFWFRPQALTPLFNLGLNYDNFTFSNGTIIDGELEHAIERLFLKVVELAGYGWQQVLFRPSLYRFSAPANRSESGNHKQQLSFIRILIYHVSDTLRVVIPVGTKRRQYVKFIILPILRYFLRCKSDFLQKYTIKLGPVESLPDNYLTRFMNNSCKTFKFSKQPWNGRPIDLLFVGYMTERRGEFFASIAPILSRYSCYFLTSDPIESGINHHNYMVTLTGIMQRSKVLFHLQTEEGDYVNSDLLRGMANQNRCHVMSDTHRDYSLSDKCNFELVLRSILENYES